MRIILIFLFIPVYCFSQQTKPNIQPTYTDVLYLMNLMDNIKLASGTDFYNIQKSIKAALNRYGIETNSVEALNDPFLKDLVEATTLELTEVNSMEIGGSNTKDKGNTKLPHAKLELEAQKEQSSSPAIGWEAAVINGLSTFMANRFKQETIYFGLNQIFGQITEREHKTFQAILPATYNEIVELKETENYYSADLVFLRKVIEGDLQKLDQRIAVNSSVLFPRLANEGQDLLKIAGQIQSNLRLNVSFPDLFRKLNSESYQTQEIRSAIEINYVISEALRDTLGSNNTWVDISFLMGNPKDNRKSRYFYGLLKEQLKDYLGQINIGLATSRIQQLISTYSDYKTTENFLKSNNYQLNKEQSLQLLGMINSSFYNYLKKYDELSFIVINSKYLTLFNSYYDIIYPLQNSEYQKGIVILLQKFKEYLPKENDNVFRRNVIFALQMAETKDAKDMEDLLNAYALPIGGSSIKRKSKFNVSLNGYVGLTAGAETTLGTTKQTKINIGLAAPIGVSATFSGKWTLFASIFDLGSIVNVRLQNDTSSFSNVKFEQFLTPGIGLYYNIAKTPFTLGAHYNYIPNLRTIKIDNGQAAITETHVSVNRLNLSLLVDIPFFTLFNKE